MTEMIPNFITKPPVHGIPTDDVFVASLSILKCNGRDNYAVTLSTCGATHTQYMGMQLGMSTRKILWSVLRNREMHVKFLSSTHMNA
jgi:hypothetical protein